MVNPGNSRPQLVQFAIKDSVVGNLATQGF